MNFARGFVSCGGCANQCHGYVVFNNKDGWTVPDDWDTQVRNDGKLVAGKHITYKGKITITCKCEKPAAARAKALKLGQTIEEVEELLDTPHVVAELGAKTVYTYTNMKIIFTDGKISNVE